MSMERLKWVLFLVPVCLVLTGCLYNNVREVEPDRAFQGLNHVYQSGGSTLNVVFVHGMGHHPFGEKDLMDYQVKIAKELGFGEGASQGNADWGVLCQAGYRGYAYFSEAEEERLQARREKDQAICPLKINNVVVGFIGWRQYRSPDNRNTLNLFELSWDRATELLQKT